MQVEINQQFAEANTHLKIGDSNFLITPPLNEDYWLMRVKLSKKQSVVCFPKFGVIGIGFQIEDYDWNTNLPSSCDALEIFNHIKRNKGSKSIKDDDCIEAIRMLQRAISQLTMADSN